MTRKQDYRYWVLWREACQARGWDERDNDLRHEVHVKALGRDKSHLEMDNRDVDRIFRFLKLLADPDNLEAIMFFQDPDREERKRLLWRIDRLAPKRYIESISVDRFGTIHYDDLSREALEQLRNTVNSRMRAKRGRGAEAAPATGRQLLLANT